MSCWPLVVVSEQKSECCVISLDLAEALKLGPCLKGNLSAQERPLSLLLLPALAGRL